MKKRLYLALALVLVLTLAACVKEDVTTAPDPSGTQAPSGNASHTHSYGDWTVVTAATCTEDGVKERVCSCGEKETEAIAASGHNYPTDETSVTVSDDGNSAEINATCTACGHAEKGAYSGVLVRGDAAYRFVDGARVTVDKEIIECDGVRYWVLDNAIQKGVYVSVNGYIYYFGEDGKMVCGGSNGEYDFDENGALTGSDIVLDIGGERYEVSGSTATVHTHRYTSTVTAPTCTESGYTTYICRCGENYIDDYVKENGHDYVDGICSVCGRKQVSEGLEFKLNYDGESYRVSGIGTCTDTDIAIPSTHDGKPVTAIDTSAFRNCTYLTSITIPDSVTSIGAYAFSFCGSLTSITIPDSVRGIGDEAFYYCSSLTSITIPDSVTCIDYRVFEACIGLTSIVIPDSVTIIGDCAFSGCSGLTSIVIPDSVTSICNYAFYGCRSLTSITIPDSVTSIGGYAFESTAYYENTDNWTDNTLYIGNYLIQAKTEISGEYIIKEGTKCIASVAFAGCSSLTSIVIPDSLTNIGYRAFYDCSSLTSVTIGNGVTSIGDEAFYDCSSLTSITLPDSVTSIGNYAFGTCIGLTSITIPDSVTSIGNYAFYNCSSLTSIIIPDSVTSIGNYVFYGCSGLTSVTFDGTMAQWNAISKSRYWNNDTGNYKIYCTDGEISK